MIYIIFFISIFLHELSHIIVGFLFGYKLKGFKILPFGMKIKFYEKNDNLIIRNIIIYIAGPIMNFIISFFFSKVQFEYSEYIVYSNLILGIFNLLPINPLDGGRIIGEILKLIYDYKKSIVYLYRITKFFLCILTFFYSLFILKYKNITILIVLIYIWYINIKEYKKLNQILKMYTIIDKCNV